MMFVIPATLACAVSDATAQSPPNHQQEDRHGIHLDPPVEIWTGTATVLFIDLEKVYLMAT
jgi:hypothetical protein